MTRNILWLDGRFGLNTVTGSRKQAASEEYSPTAPPEFIADFEKFADAIQPYVITFNDPDYGEVADGIGEDCPKELSDPYQALIQRGYANGYFASRKTAGYRTEDGYFTDDETNPDTYYCDQCGYQHAGPCDDGFYDEDEESDDDLYDEDGNWNGPMKGESHFSRRRRQAGSNLYPNGKCGACGWGVNEDGECTNKDCSNYGQQVVGSRRQAGSMDQDFTPAGSYDGGDSGGSVAPGGAIYDVSNYPTYDATNVVTNQPSSDDDSAPTEASMKKRATWYDKDSRPSAAELADLPTITQGRTDNLKWENGDDVRIWLSRMTVEDGMPYDNSITIETYDPSTGSWSDYATYDGGSLESYGSRKTAAYFQYDGLGYVSGIAPDGASCEVCGADIGGWESYVTPWLATVDQKCICRLCGSDLERRARTSSRKTAISDYVECEFCGQRLHPSNSDGWVFQWVDDIGRADCYDGDPHSPLAEAEQATAVDGYLGSRKSATIDKKRGKVEGAADARRGIAPAFTLKNVAAVKGTEHEFYIDGYVSAYLQEGL